MFWLYAADAIVVLHYAFIAFVTGGALLIFLWKRLVWLHIPALVWGSGVEFVHWPCPLTIAERWLDVQGHVRAYAGDFVEHHMFPFLYSALATVRTHLVLGILLMLINAVIYGFWFRKAGVFRSANAWLHTRR